MPLKLANLTFEILNKRIDTLQSFGKAVTMSEYRMVTAEQDLESLDTMIFDIKPPTSKRAAVLRDSRVKAFLDGLSIENAQLETFGVHRESEPPESIFSLAGDAWYGINASHICKSCC